MVRLWDEGQGARWWHEDEIAHVPTWHEQANYVCDPRDGCAFVTVAWVDGVYCEVPADVVVRRA